MSKEKKKENQNKQKITAQTWNNWSYNLKTAKHSAVFF